MDWGRSEARMCLFKAKLATSGRFLLKNITVPRGNFRSPSEQLLLTTTTRNHINHSFVAFCMISFGPCPPVVTASLNLAKLAGVPKHDNANPLCRVGDHWGVMFRVTLNSQLGAWSCDNSEHNSANTLAIHSTHHTNINHNQPYHTTETTATTCTAPNITNAHINHIPHNGCV